jgi:hypothetical protein
VSIYVSPLQTVKGRSGFWCVLVSDESLDELHSFARLIDLLPEQYKHSPTLPRYEIGVTERIRARGAGADPATVQFVQGLRGKLEIPLELTAEPIAKPRKPKKSAKPSPDTPEAPTVAPEPAQTATAAPKKRPGRPKAAKS